MTSNEFDRLVRDAEDARERYENSLIDEDFGLLPDFIAVYLINGKPVFENTGHVEIEFTSDYTYI